MNSCVESGVLRGRPFGGVMILVNNRFRQCIQVVCAAERFVIVIIGDMLIVNVYLPCSGIPNRLYICEEIFNDIAFWIRKYSDLKVLFGGDFNTDLDDNNVITLLINKFVKQHALHVCSSDLGKQCTYSNEALNRSSCIDYFFCSESLVTSPVEVLDLDANLSDHHPICVKCLCDIGDNVFTKDCDDTGNSNLTVQQLRWDMADKAIYIEMTRTGLQAVLQRLQQIELLQIDDCAALSSTLLFNEIDSVYSQVVDILLMCSLASVPSVTKGFFKFWWDQELDELKCRSIASCRLWKESGKPRSGPIFQCYRRDKSLYKTGIRNHRREATETYTNDLHRRF
jgi:hypothetical protein